MATYVVRIYRSAAGVPPRMVGVVVEPDGGMRHPFHDAEEMVERLASLEAVRTRGEKEKERHSSDR